MQSHTLFLQICFELDSPSSNWVKRWDNVTHTPYAFKDDQFISYDTVRSLTEKVLYQLFTYWGLLQVTAC
jgi:GH18 family chitinase